MKKEVVIVLNRSDINERYKNIQIHQLNLSYFSVSLRDIQEASVVMFIENGEIVYLKHRYQKYIGFVTQ